MQNSLRHLRDCNIYCCFSDTGVLIPRDYKHTDPDCPLTMKPFSKGQNNQKLCLSFGHSLVSNHTSFFCTIYCIKFCFVFFFVSYSFPQTFTVYQNLAISLLAMFFGEFFGFFGKNSIFCQLGGQFQIDQDCFNWRPL